MKSLISLILVFSFFASLTLVMGCNSELRTYAPNLLMPDGNTPIEFKGEAANIMAEQIANNLQTEASRFSDMFKKSGELFFYLILVIVGGFIFWGITKSSWGWAIPAGGMIGIGTMIVALQFGECVLKWGKYLILGLIVFSGVVIIYKAREYQRERNAN